jgi:hypothetical protein
VIAESIKDLATRSTCSFARMLLAPPLRGVRRGTSMCPSLRASPALKVVRRF